MAGTIGNAAEHARRRALPWEQHDAAGVERGEISALEFRSHQIGCSAPA
jgi:hypothetical protein